jgi:hypothetical protein
METLPVGGEPCHDAERQEAVTVYVATAVECNVQKYGVLLCH